MNSQKIAEEIYALEHDIDVYKEVILQENKSKYIGNGITIKKSEDCLIWYLWRHYDDQVRVFFKAVPALHYSKGEIEGILDAQKWVCI